MNAFGNKKRVRNCFDFEFIYIKLKDVWKNFYSFLGLFLAVFLLLLSVILGFFDSRRHKRKRICPNCGKKKAKYLSGVFEEGGGHRSYTDGIIVDYKCSCGYTFSKRITLLSYWNL